MAYITTIYFAPKMPDMGPSGEACTPSDWLKKLETDNVPSPAIVTTILSLKCGDRVKFVGPTSGVLYSSSASVVLGDFAHPQVNYCRFEGRLVSRSCCNNLLEALPGPLFLDGPVAQSFGYRICC